MYVHISEVILVYSIFTFFSDLIHIVYIVSYLYVHTHNVISVILFIDRQYTLKSIHLRVMFGVLVLFCMKSGPLVKDHTMVFLILR